MTVFFLGVLPRHGAARARRAGRLIRPFGIRLKSAMARALLVVAVASPLAG
ncbi:hypothetical protein P3102_03710 [Amycolatopsis sp. QT-25]|uniref:hypothetical protein n=1 Tax=Amycolatopsis sp. QT-25 TaxID=3034022 RepID=UPI0023EC8348|nr:hypothetical protein [Amycolatopsis sp. QT-25]WET80368.1 hypothetical protein P3102_03710 [Amycolatopsis sp. QT-25]